jgi:hypothetical protein
MCQVFGSVLICHGARIVLNPQRLDWSKMLRVETTRAPAFNLKSKLRHCQVFQIRSPLVRSAFQTICGLTNSCLLKKMDNEEFLCFFEGEKSQ